MENSKFQLRNIKQDLIITLIINLILGSIFMSSKLNIKGIDIIFTLSGFIVLCTIFSLINCGFSDLDFKNPKILKTLISLAITVIGILVIFNDVVKRFQVIYLILFMLVIVTILERAKISYNKKIIWGRENRKDYDEDEISIFWRLRVKFNPKYEGSLEGRKFKETLNENILFWGIVSIYVLIGPRLQDEGFVYTIMFIFVAIYVLFKSPAIYAIDKKLNTHIEMVGICTGIREIQQKKRPSRYKVSIVDFDNKIERVLSVKEEDLYPFSIGEETTLVYGAISKRIVKVR